MYNIASHLVITNEIFNDPNKSLKPMQFTCVFIDHLNIHRLYLTQNLTFFFNSIFCGGWTLNLNPFYALEHKFELCNYKVTLQRVAMNFCSCVCICFPFLLLYTDKKIWGFSSVFWIEMFQKILILCGTITKIPLNLTK